MIEFLSVTCGCLRIPELIIRPGRIAITGPNGSGKTTLLELTAGLCTPARGTVLINGKNPGEVSVGWLGEFPDLNMTFTRVIDEIASPLRFSGLPCSRIEERTREMAQECCLSALLNRQVRTLSGGEKVLVALAAALISGPDILILDETDSHLDPVTLTRVDRVIAASKVPLVLFATHRPDRASFADQVLVMKEGEVARYGTPDEIFSGSHVPSGRYPASFRSLRDPALWRAVHAGTS